MKKYYKYMLIPFIIVVFLCFVYINKMQFYALNTNSMEPRLQEGSLLIGKKEAVDTLKTGDIIAFKDLYSDTISTQRIVSKQEMQQLLYVKADKADKISEIKFAQYDSTICYRIPYIGKILYFFKGSKGKFILFILLFFLLIKLGISILEERKRLLK